MTPANQVPLKVLVIDDDEMLLRSYQMGLPLVGPFTVVPAENGVEGLERFFEVQPDCVVIDVKMPQLDGYQLVRALRGDVESAATPLIILTALGQNWNEYVGMASGADRYLVKPVRPSALAVAINEVCQISQADRARRQHQLAERDQPERG